MLCSVVRSSRSIRLSELTAIRITIESEFNNEGLIGILRVADLVEKAKNPKWDDWFGDTKRYWIGMAMLDQEGNMHSVTREGILIMLAEGLLTRESMVYTSG